MNTTTKTVLRYTLLPGFIPRFKALFIAGFQHIPYLIALVYQIVRLLPAGHPYLRSENFGQYGIRHVIAEAANNVTLSKDNIDQIAVFILVLVGIVMAFAQIGLLIFAAAINPALAAAQDMGIFNALGFINVQNPSQDLAMMLLDMVFGIPDLFNSCISQNTACTSMRGEAIATDMVPQIQSIPFPYRSHLGLHALLNFYNTGLLMVALLITSYFIATIVAETAQTGVPFGKRFNKVWAPIRLVVAIGMLVPISYGMNGAQYIVLYAAKFGSHFATNGWTQFTQTLFGLDKNSLVFNGDDQAQALGVGQRLMTAPNPPSLKSVLQFLYTARICAEGYEYNRDKQNANDPPLKAYIMPSGSEALTLAPETLDDITDFATDIREPIDNYSAYFNAANSYENLIQKAKGSHYINIRFGTKTNEKVNQSDANKFKHGIKPVCGELGFQLLDPRNPDAVDPNNRPQKGVEIIQRVYWFIILDAWYNRFYVNPGATENHPFALYTFCEKAGIKECGDIDINQGDTYPKDGPSNLLAHITYYQQVMACAIHGAANYKNCPKVIADGIIPKLDDKGALRAQEKEILKNYADFLIHKGWGGAALWYNKIAEMNGTLSSAIFNAPAIVHFPAVMEEVEKEKKSHEEQINELRRYEPRIAGDGKALQLAGGAEALTMAHATWNGFALWNNTDIEMYRTGNALETLIKVLFGIEGLYDLRNNIGTHPLAQLSAVGRSLIQATIVNLLGGGASTILGHIGAKTLGDVGLGLTFSIATATLTLGFFLYYVVPFLPFVYFFFALGGWVKGVFEAIVGAPLWALAHIRIDGEGLPGQAAIGGYFLVFEIFLRPILIIFGLVASISIFSAMVNVMHEVWDIAVSNVAGGGSDASDDILTKGINSALGTELDSISDWARSPIDEFFYTVLYAIVVYMMGLSTFKLIDLIPNNILRWMGQNVKTFNDSREDAGQALIGSTYTSGQQAISGLSTALKGLAKPK